MREETTEMNRRLTDKTLVEVADPKETYVPPALKEPVPFLNLSPLQNASSKLQDADQGVRRGVAEVVCDGGAGVSANAQASVDAVLIQTERVLTTDQGLPRRPWFKHAIYAPGSTPGMA